MNIKLISLLLPLALFLGGCAGSSGGSGSKAVKLPDFAIYDAQALAKVVLHNTVPPGGTRSFPLNLISVNGWNQPINIQIANVPSGWTASLSKPTYNSLPVGVTVDTLTLTAPSTAVQAATFSNSFNISATSGSYVRKLDDFYFIDGIQSLGSYTGSFPVQVAGLSLGQFSSGNNALAIAPPLTDTQGLGYFSLNGVGLTGPITLTLVNNNPGLSVSLVNSTLNPNTDGTYNEGGSVNFHATAGLDHGAYPVTITATDAKDGFSAQGTFNLDLSSDTLDAPPPPLNLGSHQIGTVGSMSYGITLEGYPGQVVDVVTSFPGYPQAVPPGVNIQVSPTTITLPASGKVDQQITVTATVTGQLSPGSYPNIKIGTQFTHNFLVIHYTTYTLNVQ